MLQVGMQFTATTKSVSAGFDSSLSDSFFPSILNASSHCVALTDLELDLEPGWLQTHREACLYLSSEVLVHLVSDSLQYATYL